MRIRHLLISLFLIGIVFISCIWISTFFRNRGNNEIQDIKNNPYFLPVPITKFSSIQAPCLIVEIGDKTFTADLDLGFKGCALIQTNALNEIEGRSQISSTVKYSFKGKAYPKNIYKIPKMKIENMVFSDLYIEEEDGEMNKDMIFVRDGGEPSPQELITLGWELFGNVNLFMDLKNSRIAFCDSFSTLQEVGYPPDKFVKVPLVIDRGFVEVDAVTPSGAFRCMIDTGATFNFLNIENEEGRALEEIFWDPKSNTEFTSFKMGEKDFGPTSFHHLPIRFPIHVDAILGMEFLRNHLVFIDFQRKEIYFAESTKEEEAAEMAAAS